MVISKKNIIEEAKNIKLLACDVDCVLIHGEIIVLNDGEEIKIWNVKDGMGYNEFSDASPRIETAWMTGRRSFQVEKRAKDMNIDYLVQSCMTKIAALNKILKSSGFNASETAYIGDNIVDSVLKEVGFSVCPLDCLRRNEK